MLAWLMGLAVSVPTVRAESTEDPEPAALVPMPRGSRVAVLPSTTAQTRALAGGPAQHEEATRAINAALRKQGYEVIGADEVHSMLEAHLPDGCRDAVTCDPALALQTLRADAVVSLALWHRAGGNDQLLVHVRRTRSYGQAELPIGPKGVGATAAQALDKALDDTLLRHEVRVRIESQPRGASVHIDQALVGATPATLDVSPGNHLVTLEMPGYVTAANYVDVPATGKAALVHSVTLLKAQGASTEAPPLMAASAESEGSLAGARDDRDRSDVTNYVVAAVLGAVAVPLLANAIYAASRSGDCTGPHDLDGNCGARAEVGTSFWLSLSVGMAAGLGAGGVLIFQPFSGSGESPDGASLAWRGSF